MGQGNALALLVELLDSRVEVAESTAPSNDEDFAALVADNLQRGYVHCGMSHLLSPEVHHHLMVLGVGGNDSGGILLKTSYAVLQTGGAGHCPSADKCLGVSLEGAELAAALGSARKRP